MLEKLQAVQPLLYLVCCVPIVGAVVVLTGGQSDQGKIGFRLRAYPKTEPKIAAGVEHDRSISCSSHGGEYELRLV
jgi:hypothetical protein